MKIVIAPNALKGSLGADAAARAIADGVRRVQPDAEITAVPVADGGDGLLEVLGNHLDGERRTHEVTGPLGEPVSADFIYSASRRTAVIEMAAASGLALLGAGEPDAMRATSYGLGELMRHALDAGAEQLIIGIGGSATVDGGTGMAAALGMRFLDENGDTLPGDGQSLARIMHIDREHFDPGFQNVRITVACDVDNPLLGEKGAARVFGPQKGATSAQVRLLGLGLANLARLITEDTGIDVSGIPGGGAAGGMGAAMIAWLGAELKPGAELVLEMAGMEQALENADLVITAEGQLDGQTRHGKAPAAVAAKARQHGVPCIAIGGALGAGYEELAAAGIDACFSLCNAPMTLDAAMRDAEKLITNAAEQVVRCFIAGKNSGEGRGPSGEKC